MARTMMAPRFFADVLRHPVFSLRTRVHFPTIDTPIAPTVRWFYSSDQRHNGLPDHETKHTHNTTRTELTETQQILDEVKAMHTCFLSLETRLLTLETRLLTLEKNFTQHLVDQQHVNTEVRLKLQQLVLPWYKR